MILSDHLDSSKMRTLRKFVRDGDMDRAEAFLRANPPLSGSWREADFDATLADVVSLEKAPA